MTEASEVHSANGARRRCGGWGRKTRGDRFRLCLLVVMGKLDLTVVPGAREAIGEFKVRHLINAFKRSLWVLRECTGDSLERSPAVRLRGSCTILGGKMCQPSRRGCGGGGRKGLGP